MVCQDSVVILHEREGAEFSLHFSQQENGPGGLGSRPANRRLVFDCFA